MSDETEFQKLKEEYPEFFKEGPIKLIELANSEKTASQIAEICSKNEIEDEGKIENIAYYIASVLLGSLPPKILPKALTTNLKIDAKLAEKISIEANQLIFSQAKDELDKLYPSVQPEKPAPPLEETRKRSPKKDTYHEPIE